MAGRPKIEGLSEAQEELYLFIISFVQTNGFQPSRSEMAESFGISPAAVRDRLFYLANKGFIEFGPVYTDRCLRLPHVTFQATASSSPPEPPRKTVEASPSSMEVIRKAMEEVLFQRHNRAMSAPEFASELGVVLPKIYQALNAPGRFQKVNSPDGKRSLWKMNR